MQELILGKTIQGKDIKAYLFGDENAFNKTLIIGCMHGTEYQSKEFCDFYIEEIKEKKFYSDSFLILIPCLNPDGLEKKERTNANGVDLNRNFPSNSWTHVPHKGHSAYFPGIKPASEPETKVIIDLLNKYNFKKIISIHTNYTIKNPNLPMINYDGSQSRELAEKISLVTGLPTHADVGYPTPGSLGTYIGNDLKKISVTVELDHKKKSDELYKKCGRVFEVGVLFT